MCDKQNAIWCLYFNPKRVGQFLCKTIRITDLLSSSARQQADILSVPPFGVPDDGRQQTWGHICLCRPESDGGRGPVHRHIEVRFQRRDLLHVFVQRIAVRETGKAVFQLYCTTFYDGFQVIPGICAKISAWPPPAFAAAVRPHNLCNAARCMECPFRSFATFAPALRGCTVKG